MFAEYTIIIQLHYISRRHSYIIVAHSYNSQYTLQCVFFPIISTRAHIDHEEFVYVTDDKYTLYYIYYSSTYIFYFYIWNRHSKYCKNKVGLSRDAFNRKYKCVYVCVCSIPLLKAQPIVSSLYPLLHVFECARKNSLFRNSQLNRHFFHLW